MLLAGPHCHIPPARAGLRFWSLKGMPMLYPFIAWGCSNPSDLAWVGRDSEGNLANMVIL